MSGVFFKVLSIGVPILLGGLGIADGKLKERKQQEEITKQVEKAVAEALKTKKD